MSDDVANPMGLAGLEFVEFASPVPDALEPLCEKMGLPWSESVAKGCAPRAGHHLAAGRFPVRDGRRCSFHAQRTPTVGARSGAYRRIIEEQGFNPPRSQTGLAARVESEEQAWASIPAYPNSRPPPELQRPDAVADHLTRRAKQ